MAAKNAADEGKTFTLEDLERARAEERDKLYPQLSKTDERTKAMQEELASLRKFQKDQEKAEEKRQAEVAAAQKQKEEAELSAKELIEQRTREMQEQVEALRKQQEAERALFEREREFQQMQIYRNDRLTQESDSIAPEFREYVGGTTQEEIEASIERAKANTQSILDGLQAAQTAARAGQTGVRSGPPAITPLDAPGSQELSAEDIKAMPWNDFAKLRQARGMGGSGQGLFG